MTESSVSKTKNLATTFNYVDLFAGCGGLSLGLEASGGNLIFAVERSPMAAETFMKNLVQPTMDADSWQDHLAATLEVQLRQKLVVDDVRTVKANKSVLGLLKNTSEIHLIAGGPPCQGFSMAGRRKQTDSRNSLAWDFLDLVQEANPDFVLIENVPGMNRKFKSQKAEESSAYEQLTLALSSIGNGYLVQRLALNAMHYGAPQNRPRLFLLGISKSLADRLSISVTDEIWVSAFLDEIQLPIPPLAPMPKVTSSNVRTVRDAFEDLLESKSKINPLLKELGNPLEWGLAERSGLGNTELRNHSQNTVTKFELFHLLKRLGFSPSLIRYPEEPSSVKITDLLDQSSNLKFSWPLLSTNGRVLAQNVEELQSLLDRFRTSKHSQRVLEMSKPSPTVISSPDDYIHPTQARVLSVREMARLQGFPDAFQFFSKVTTGGTKRSSEVPQYTQVGNAISPYISLSLGKMLSDLITKSRV